MGDAVVDGAAADSPAEPGNGQPRELAEAIAGLTGQIQAHHARAQARERVIDQLHAEVERLRAGADAVLLRPVVTDLQHLRADLLHQARTLPGPLDADQAVKLLESFALSVELALERCGSVPVRPEPGTAFSPREHRAAKVVEAATPEEDGTLAEVVADGYRDTATGRVTVPARVHVRRWTPRTTQTTQSTQTTRPAPAEEQQQNAETGGNTDV
ncbi:nucleotide exchange factor GrpE [Amycolatopsis rhizosphaerae]|uniref:Nucleotide exchange factor GrpE n=1 Tax=Amycolatopsis rhizosphaerae TaxID=2053003 RepID=A0A558DF31_9PSEU|nr:nucleotide exchange factor GrpE [Amycolatopsis rhizosphaerae]TVT59473.1 nucleotide exchange factor GrpE [Amycolatopsis rhizosphaerae]